MLGSTDAALRQAGFDQMRAAAECHGGWDAVISSPLRRCGEFAEWLCHERQLTLRVDERWRELDFGDWEGRGFNDVAQEQPELTRLFYTRPQEFCPPNGESVANLQKRVAAAFDELLDLHRGRHVLVIQHGGTSRVLLARILQMPLANMMRIDIPHACVTRIRVFHDGDEDHPVLMAHIPQPAQR